MHIIPDTWSHFHMLVSVFPLVGLLFVMGFYVTGIVTKNDALNRFCDHSCLDQMSPNCHSRRATC